MDINTLAAIGFCAEFASSIFIFLVLIRQWKLFKSKIQPSLIAYRRVLFSVAIVAFIGSVVNMAIDFLTVLSLVTRTTNHANPIGATYFIDNSVKSLLLSLLIWILYRMAAKTPILLDQDKSATLHDRIGAEE